jgi:transposase
VGQITVYSGPERRRRWSDEQRLQILTEAFAPGACPTEVARRHDISTGQLYTWRKKLSVGSVAPVIGSEGCPGFAEAVIVDDHLAAMPDIGAALVIELARGRRITIFPSASPALAAAVLKALR